MNNPTVMEVITAHNGAFCKLTWQNNHYCVIKVATKNERSQFVLNNAEHNAVAAVFTELCRQSN